MLPLNRNFPLLAAQTWCRPVSCYWCGQQDQNSDSSLLFFFFFESHDSGKLCVAPVGLVKNLRLSEKCRKVLPTASLRVSKESFGNH